MKRILFAMGVLLAITALAACAKAIPAAPAAEPPEPAKAQNIMGNLTGVNTPAQTGPDVVVIQTPQGTQDLPITANTTINLEGKSCTVDQLAALDLANVSYNCSVVIGPDDNGSEIVVAVNVTKIVPGK